MTDKALEVACPVCGAQPGKQCWNLRFLHAFNPNRLSDHQRITKPHAGRVEAVR